MEEEKPETLPPAPETAKLPEEEERTFLATNLLPLVVGTLVVVLAIGLGTYWFATKAPKTKQPAKKEAAKVSPTPSLGQVLTQADSKKPYSDSKFGYSLALPKDWEVAKRNEDADGYQLAVFPSGSGDVPITVNAQVNRTPISLDAWVNTLFGQAYPRERVKVRGDDALLVVNQSQSYKSYFVAHANSLFELSVATANVDYVNIFDQILASLTFTK